MFTVYSEPLFLILMFTSIIYPTTGHKKSQINWPKLLLSGIFQVMSPDPCITVTSHEFHRVSDSQQLICLFKSFFRWSLLLHSAANIFWPLCIHSATTAMRVPPFCLIWATGEQPTSLLIFVQLSWTHWKLLQWPLHPQRCLNILCTIFGQARQPCGLLLSLGRYSQLYGHTRKAQMLQ